MRSLLSVVGLAASVGCAVKTGRSSSLATTDEIRSLVESGPDYAIDRRLESAVVFHHLAHAMGLLGDVGQIEVGGEGAHQLDDRAEIERAQSGIELPRRLGVVVVPDRLAEGAHLLDQVEQPGPVLTSQCLAKLRSQPADVGAKHLIPVGGRRTCHPCSRRSWWLAAINRCGPRPASSPARPSGHV